jgi:signal peptidase
MKKYITSLLCLIIVGAWFFTLAPTSLGGPAGFVLVKGESMEPTFYTGDLVVTHKQSSYQPGDIVSFRVASGQVIHRIKGGNGQDGYVTQGDNVTSVDPWHPTGSQIVGKEWLHIAGAGNYVKVLREPSVAAAVFAGVVAVWIFNGKRAQLRRRRRATAGVFITQVT